MGFSFSIVPHRLRFSFQARTSRGSMSEHRVWYLVLKHSEFPDKSGIGECAPLPGLSPDAAKVEEGLRHFLTGLQHQNLWSIPDLEEVENSISASDFPSLKFAVQTAILDYRNGGTRTLFPSGFTSGKQGIPINGLIWMSNKSEMLNQVKSKIEQGFACLKLKIGALDFEHELDVLRYIRQEFPDCDLTIRVDANGAFKPAEALEKLQLLSEYGLHSIEQPIQAGQWDEMAELCRKSPVPVALDEELIGMQELGYKQKLLNQLKPPYIILKPTLVGGLTSAQEWIDLAEKQNIGWWMTSALESNIGLNAIAQFTATKQPEMPQGLGTGQLYHNNVPSPLSVESGYLYYQHQNSWDLSLI